MPYFYKTHMTGAIYESDEMLDSDTLYCEVCGDSDEFLGYFDSYEECMSAWSDYDADYENEEFEG